MRQGGDDRAQSVQIGVIVLFGFLVVAVSAYQAFVVPQENARVEFDDYQGSTADVVSLRNAMLASAADGNVRGRAVSTGTGYPVRALFVNPPPAAGTLRTTEESNVSVSGITAAGDHANVDSYLASESNSLAYTTRTVAFEPGYDEFDDAAPVVLEGGVVYRDYERPVVSTAQTLVDGNRIRLVTVSGNVRAEGLSTALTVAPVSAHTRTVTVTNRSSATFNVTVPTDLSESTWEDLLADQLDADGSHPDRYVRSVTKPDGADHVDITMEGDQQYELQIARLELREESDPNREVTPDARYLVADGDNRTRTSEDGRARLVVEARDRYNNPVSNSVVTFDASEGTFERADGSPIDRNESADGAQLKTDWDGKAVVYFNATGNLGTIPVDAVLGTDDATSDGRMTRFHVFNSVLDGDGGGSGGDAGRNLVVLNDTGFDSEDGTVTLTLENIGDFPANVTGYRLDYAVVYGQGDNNVQDGPEHIGYLTADGAEYPNETSARPAAREGRAPYFFESGRTITIPGDSTVEVTLHFDPAFTYDGSESGALSLAFYLEGDLTVTVVTFDD